MATADELTSRRALRESNRIDSTHPYENAVSVRGQEGVAQLKDAVYREPVHPVAHGRHFCVSFAIPSEADRRD